MYVLCKNLDELFQAKMLKTDFFTKISPPDPPRRSATLSDLSDLWGFKLWLLLHLCQTNFVLIFAVCVSITTPWIQKYEIVRQEMSQFFLDIYSLHTIKQILDPKRDVTAVRSHSFVSRASLTPLFWWVKVKIIRLQSSLKFLFSYFLVRQSQNYQTSSLILILDRLFFGAIFSHFHLPCHIWILDSNSWISRINTLMLEVNTKKHVMR